MRREEDAEIVHERDKQQRGGTCDSEHRNPREPPPVGSPSARADQRGAAGEGPEHEIAMLGHRSCLMHGGRGAPDADARRNGDRVVG